MSIDSLKASMLIRLALVVGWIAALLTRVSLRTIDLARVLSEAGVAISERALWFARKAGR